MARILIGYRVYAYKLRVSIDSEFRDGRERKKSQYYGKPDRKLPLYVGITDI